MVTIYLVTGPPAAGKSTWVREHAQHGDITIDYDTIASVLTPPGGKPHQWPATVKAVTKAARQAAIDAATKHRDTDTYIIHSTPSPALIAQYQNLGANIIVIDPGIDTVLARAKAERPWQMQQAIKEWYANPPSQQTNPANPANAGTGADTTRAW